MKNILNQVKEIKEIQGIKIKVSGRITVRFRANPYHRRLYRLIDYSRLDNKNIPAKVETIEYDPNRTGFIMRVCYFDPDFFFQLSHQ